MHEILGNFFIFFPLLLLFLHLSTSQSSLLSDLQVLHILPVSLRAVNGLPTSVSLESHLLRLVKDAWFFLNVRHFLLILLLFPLFIVLQVFLMGGEKSFNDVLINIFGGHLRSVVRCSNFLLHCMNGLFWLR